MIRRLVVEPPMEAAEVVTWVTPDEVSQAQHFAPARAREWLAWHALVRRELGRDVAIAYNAVGAPEVSLLGVYLSVAHCKGRIAICLSDAPCAVDIEPENRNFQRVASRYMTPDEQLLDTDPLLPAVVWCAKEALYKYAGRQELDLRQDLHVEQVDLVAGVVLGRIENGEPLSLSVLCHDGFVVVYLLAC